MEKTINNYKGEIYENRITINQNQVDEHFGHCEYLPYSRLTTKTKYFHRKPLRRQLVVAANRTLPRYWQKWA